MGSGAYIRVAALRSASVPHGWRCARVPISAFHRLDQFIDLGDRRRQSSAIRNRHIVHADGAAVGNDNGPDKSWKNRSRDPVLLRQFDQDRLRASALSPDVIGPPLGEQVGAAAPNFDLKRLASDDRQSLPGFKAPAALALSQDSLDLDERGFLVGAGACDGFLGSWRGGLFGNAARTPWRGGNIRSPESIPAIRRQSTAF